MKKTYLAKLAIISFTVVAVFAFTGAPAQAESGTISATISIATPIGISSDSALIFGVFTAPTVAQSWTINPANGDLITLGGDGTDIFNDDHHRGGFSITGEPLAAITYSAGMTTDFGDPGTSLTSVSVDPIGANLPSGGTLTVGIGGRVSLQSSAATGSDAVITLTANYQ